MIIAAPEFLWLLITNQFEVDLSQIFQSEFEAKTHYKKGTLLCNMQSLLFPSRFKIFTSYNKECYLI